jgi:hypothetical protein
MKVSKEDVIGVLTALEIWFERRDPAAEARRWNDDLATIADCLAAPGVTATVIAPHDVVRVPRLRVTWDASGLDGETLRRRLLEGEPRVMLDDMAVTANAIEIDPFGLQPGEAAQVGKTIAALLRAPVAGDRPARPVPKIDVSGTWEVGVSFLRGHREHRMTLRQQDNIISGEHNSHQFAGPVVGTIDDGGIDVTFSAWHEGSMIAYRLTGPVADGRITGDATFGSATAHRQGPINMTQFGQGRFEAVRVGQEG